MHSVGYENRVGGFDATRFDGSTGHMISRRLHGDARLQGWICTTLRGGALGAKSG